MKLSALSRTLLIASALIALSSCSGGGEEGGEGRTTGTGLRIVHGAIDASPITVFVDDVEFQTAGFAEPTEYMKTGAGTRVLRVERARSPGVVVSTLAFPLEKETEYSLFAYGEAARGTFLVSLLPEPIERPEEGFARVQVLNALQGSSSVRVTAGDLNIGIVGFGTSSGYVQTTSGPRTFVLSNPQGGQLATITLDLADRGDVSVLICGSVNLGAVVTRAYLDLD